MIEFFVMYCERKDYDIIGEKVFFDGRQIGDICYHDKIITLGSKKFKFGDFALAILENYCDLYDGGEYVNVQG